MLASDMPAGVLETNYNWLCTGHSVFPAMLSAIDGAQTSVRLETYIFGAGSLGERFREALMRARGRGVCVKVLLDAFGSYGLPAGFWDQLKSGGGEVRFFNPITINRLGLRNHRKLLVCDEQVAFVGGFNISEEYEGDGVTCGWSDVGLRIEGPLCSALSASFENMFSRADFKHKPFIRLRRGVIRKTIHTSNEQLLLSGPGRGPSPIQRALSADLARAQSVQITAAYFLPTWRLRRRLTRIARRGGVVQLILPGKTDVKVSQLAARSLYRRLLAAGVQIYEYQPQVLHAKLVVIDNATYVGSANFDLRSFKFNYELMVRFEDAEMATQARQVFEANLKHSTQITAADWKATRSFWSRLKQRWAYFLLARVDPYIARWQVRAIPD